VPGSPSLVPTTPVQANEQDPIPPATGVFTAQDQTTIDNLISPQPNLPVQVKKLVASTLTPLLRIDFSKIPDLTSAVKIRYAVECTDGVNSQIQSGDLNANVARTSAGAYTTNSTPTGTTNTVTSGGMTPTFSWTTSGNIATLNVSVTTSLTPTDFHINYNINFATHPLAVSAA
jgi:hypothetical protein